MAINFSGLGQGGQQTLDEYMRRLSFGGASERRQALGGNQFSSADIQGHILGQAGLTQDQISPQMQAQLDSLMGHTTVGNTGEFGTKLKGFLETAPAAVAQLQAQQEQQKQFDPYAQAGTSALAQQQALLGLKGQDAMQQAYMENPAQAFARKQAEQALMRNASATGGLGGSGVQRELMELTSGLTNQNIQNQLSQLSGMSGRGLQAAGFKSGIYGQSGETQAGQMVDANAIAAREAAMRQAARDAERAGKRGLVSSAINLGAGIMTGGASLPFTQAMGGGANVIPGQPSGGAVPSIGYDSTLANPYKYG